MVPVTSELGGPDRENFLRAWRGDEPPARIPEANLVDGELAQPSSGGLFLAIQIRSGGFGGYSHYPHRDDAEDTARGNARNAWIGGLWAVCDDQGLLLYRSDADRELRQD